ncbi:MAG: galactokinase [Leptospiraceae bacterium]|nr:galactokinase [Leptospiraceae bacterium]MCK6380055.1 galactokinase [Leptospiraceae bacterium]NUM40648.1 galactokinase [Leptospiraceae bacterium]
MLLDKQGLENLLIQKFGDSTHPIRFFQAPARINIIGEHVDYLGGLVLPAAISFFTNVAIRKRDDSFINLYSVQFSETVNINSLETNKFFPWVNYIIGVVIEIKKLANQEIGFELIIDGNIPQGAGLSSSASLEVAVGRSISEIFHLNLSKEDIAVIGQKAENNFVGMKCGIMDQFIISVGKKNNCILLNTITLEFTYHNFYLQGYEWTLIHSGVKHSLKDSEYNTRRKECESALNKIQKKFPQMQNLYNSDIFTEYDNLGLTKEELNRVRHVLGEKKRTKEILKHFKEKNPELVGQVLYETHKSLSELFEVSCIETNHIVAFLKNSKITGARMIGGGFGGCILVLCKLGELEKIRNSLISDYQNTFGIELHFLNFEICDGVKEF